MTDSRCKIPIAVTRVRHWAYHCLYVGGATKGTFSQSNIKFTKALFWLAAIFAISVAGASEPIQIRGSSTVFNSFLRDAESKIESTSGHELKVLPNGSGSGLSDLAMGKADIAMISSSIESVATKLNSKRPGFIEIEKFQAFWLRDVEAVFIVHPSNPVANLTDEEIAGLLSGEISNWREVGGANRPVLVITMIPGDGVRSAVESNFLNRYGKEFSDSARQVPSANQASNIVAQVPHAIGVAGSATIHPGIKVLPSESKVVQKLFFVTKGKPNETQRGVIEAAQGI